MSEGGEREPRVLVTGFGAFPGVPANPTEGLIDALRADPAALAGSGDVRLETLAVDYRALPGRLEALGREHRPDIALHWGVSGRARAFAIERCARNSVCTLRPDASGHVPALAVVREGGETLATSLPVAAILSALERAGLPAEVSDDAGDYLCNSLFYLSRGAHCAPFAPLMAGFVHVPPFGARGPDGAPFTPERLKTGALVVLRATVEAWRRRAPETAPGC